MPQKRPPLLTSPYSHTLVMGVCSPSHREMASASPPGDPGWPWPCSGSTVWVGHWVLRDHGPIGPRTQPPDMEAPGGHPSPRPPWTRLAASKVSRRAQTRERDWVHTDESRQFSCLVVTQRHCAPDDPFRAQA